MEPTGFGNSIEAKEGAPPSGLKRIKVLVVDDEPQVLSLVQEGLGGQYDLTAASTGESGLEQVFVVNPDVLLTDVHLPDIDGIELIRQALLVNPRLRIIVMTGFGSPQLRDRALSQGALRFMEKPLNMAALRQNLQDITQRPFGWSGSGMDLLDLSQVMLLCRKSSVVLYEDAGRGGVLVFEEGQVVHASTQEAQGESAYFQMIFWREGHFRTLAEGAENYERNIGSGTAQLLLEGARLRDEHERGGTPIAAEQTSPNGLEVVAESSKFNSGGEMSQIKELLNVFMREEGTRAALVVDWDGFVIEGVVKDLSLGMEAIGAVISTSLGATQVIGRELQVGGVNLAMLEFDKGTVLVRVLGANGILAVLVDPTTNLGLPRLHIRKLAPQLEEALG